MIADLLRDEPQAPFDPRLRWSVEHQHYSGSVTITGLFDERDARTIYGAYRERLQGEPDTWGVLRCDGAVVESWGAREVSRV